MAAKHVLLLPGDDIGLTLRREKQIDAFEAKRRAQSPWL